MPKRTLDNVADQELTFLRRIGAIPNRFGDRPNQRWVGHMLGHLNHTTSMNTSIQPTNESHYGRLALALCLGGTLLAIVIGLVARLLGYDARMWAYLVFAAFQIAAIIIGWRFRREHLGRASAITASILLVLSFALLA